MSLRTFAPVLLAVATLLAPALGARAADLDENYGYAEGPQQVPVTQTKVEFGTGWYVRADIAATRLPDLGLTTVPNNPPNIALKDGSQYGYNASFGFGYEFNRWFRSDVAFDFHKPIGIRTPGTTYLAGQDPQYGNYQNTSGTCQIGYVSPTTNVFYPAYLDCSTRNEAQVQSFDVLVNGYAQLGQFGIVSPYIGAGTGLSFGHYSSSLAYYFNDGTHYDTSFTLPGSSVMVHGYADKRVSANYYNFAFALMAGVSIDVYAHTKLDIGYRYLNLGQVLGTTLQYHEARLGLRYMIDN